MNAGVPALCAAFICMPATGAAQETGQPPAAVEAPSGEARPGNIEGLPGWLRLGAELQGRAELHAGSAQDPGLRAWLNRLRISAAVQPVRWLGFYLEGQDARAIRLNAGPALEDGRDALDLRQGYVALGDSEQGFLARVGRQELSVGDERLLGADNYWSPLGQAFDAVRLSFAGERFRGEAFTGFRVQPARRRPDRWDRMSRISGASVRLETGRGQGVIETYVLWKRAGGTLDLAGRPGHRDVVAPGVRAKGDLPPGLDYNVEMTLQRGHVAGDRIAAWGGHWEIGWRPLGKELGPRLALEYNFASGDADPEDGRHHTFDDLYPAGFNVYGIADPFAWRNIRYPAVAAEAPITRRWSSYGGWRSYRLATVRDGLYPGGDTYLVRHPAAASAHIGSQLFFSAVYACTGRWRVSAGYGRLFPGGYLRQTGYPFSRRTVYLLSSYRF